MHDAGKIVPGLILFLGLVTTPIWYNAAGGGKARLPEIEKPRNATRCIEDTAYMRREHMRVLNQWRDDVVRRGERVFVSSDGHHYDKSLTGTCLGCHQSKANSCDRCHDALDVSPVCWQCHVDPKGGW